MKGCSESGKWRRKGARSMMRRPHLWAEMEFQWSSHGASSLSWLVVPCSPLAPRVKLSLQVVALRVHVTAHSETTSPKEKAWDLSHNETAVGCGEGGPLWGSGSILLSEDASTKLSSCLHFSCSVSSPLLTQIHIFSCKFSAEDFLLSHFNLFLKQLQFLLSCASRKHNFYKSCWGEDQVFCQARAQKKKKNPNEVYVTPWEYPACCGRPREISRAWWALALLVTEDLLRSPLRSWGAATRAGSGLVVCGCAYTRGKRELALFAEGSKWATAALKLLHRLLV